MKRIRLLPAAVAALWFGALAPGLALALEVSAVCTGNVRLDGDQVGNPLLTESYGPGSANCLSWPVDATNTGAASGSAHAQGQARQGLQQAYSSALAEVSLNSRPSVNSAASYVLGNTEVRLVDNLTLASGLVSPGTPLSVTLGYSLIGSAVVRLTMVPHADHRQPLRQIYRLAAMTRSAAFSPIMMQGAFVLVETIVGMIDASATRKASRPRTRNSGSTTAPGSLPILHVPIGCHEVCPVAPAYASSCSSLDRSLPGRSSRLINRLS
jgi:hypothetical protein